MGAVNHYAVYRGGRKVFAHVDRRVALEFAAARLEWGWFQGRLQARTLPEDAVLEIREVK